MAHMCHKLPINLDGKKQSIRSPLLPPFSRSRQTPAVSALCLYFLSLPSAHLFPAPEDVLSVDGEQCCF